MNSEDTKDNDEAFFSRLDPQLTSFFGMTESDVSDQELNYCYPILSDLTAIEEQYEVLEKVGQGGMKKIYRVKERKTNRFVAMAKMVSSSHRESVEYFLREARLTSSLQHPNIVTVHSIGLDEDANPYFTMELLKGNTLAEVVKADYKQEVQGSREVRDKLLGIFSKVCDAIDYAHSKQIIHLDLKPQNINIGAYGEVIVMDWGLAKILTDGDELEIAPEMDPNELNHVTLQGMIKGTPGYMAPEQTISYGMKDARSDVYALGAILYTCLTGKAPIEGEDVDEMLRRTQQGDVRGLHEVLGGKGVALGLEALVLKALSVDPDDRYQTVAELKSDLDKYSRGFATSAEDASFVKQLALLLKRHKKTVSLLFFSLVVISCILAYAFSHIHRERNNAIAARQEAEASQGVAEQNLALLKQEEGVSHALRENVDGLIFDVLHSEDISSAKRKISLLDQAIEREVNQEDLDALRRRKAVLHFVIQEFDQTLASLDACEKMKNPGYYRLAKQGVELKGGAEYLSDEGLAQLFSQMGANYADVIFSIYEKHIKFYRSDDAPIEGYVQLATIMLNMNNRIWDGTQHSDLIGFKDGKLNLSGHKYRNLCGHYGQGYNILAPFMATHVDLSDTLFFEFVQLRGLQVETLNIAGCSVNNINKARCKIMKSCGVKVIHYDSKLLSADEVELLKDQFEVVDVNSLE